MNVITKVRQLRITKYEKSSCKTQIRLAIFLMKLLIITMRLEEYMHMMRITVLVNLTKVGPEQKFPLDEDVLEIFQ